MDVLAEGDLVLDDLDVAAEFGVQTPGMVEVGASVLSDTLDLLFGSVARQALVNAVEVLAAGEPNDAGPEEAALASVDGSRRG